jgi:hypothetical protein
LSIFFNDKGESCDTSMTDYARLLSFLADSIAIVEFISEKSN